MARTKSDKKTYPVKLTLTENLYNELNERAARQGITTAAWVTYVIGEKLAAIKRQEDTADKLSREIMEQLSQMTMDKLTAMIESEELDNRVEEASKDYLKHIANSLDKAKK
jgi:mannitol-1-phosphate/altronate dehydrogenase